MQCPICHDDVQDYVVPADIPGRFSSSLEDLCPDWKSSVGICYHCIDSVDMKLDVDCQHILNGVKDENLVEAPFAYYLDDKERQFWFHTDRHIKSWFHAEIRQKVAGLARTEHHHSWVILDTNSLLLDKGDITNLR